MTKTEQTTEQFIRFANLIEPVPLDERGLIVTGILEQVASGAVRAVPVSPEPLTVEYTGMDGADTSAQLPDLLIQDSTKLQSWLTEKRRECRYEVMKGRGTIITSLERIQTKDDDFTRLAEMYRLQLAADQSKKSGRGGKADTAAHPPKHKSTTTSAKLQQRKSTPKPPASAVTTPQLPNLADGLMDNPVLNPNANGSLPAQTEDPITAQTEDPITTA